MTNRNESETSKQADPKPAAALKLGFFSQDNSSNLQTEVLEAALISLHTVLHPNSMTVLASTPNRIRELGLKITEACFRMESTSGVDAQSELDSRLLRLRELCDVSLPVSQFRA
jgi:hypothetical protein